MAEKRHLSIEYSKQSLENAKEIVLYLKKRFTEKEVNNFYNALANFEKLIIRYPTLYPESRKKNIRRAVMSKVLSIYYSTQTDKISIIAIFDNRWDRSNKIK